MLLAWTGHHPVAAPLIFTLAYIVSVALSLPQGTLLTATSGLLFGPILGGSLSVIGATIGAVCLFLIARSAFGDQMAHRGGATVTKLRHELAKNGFSYLLAIRLIPLAPFWLVNLAAALCGMTLGPFTAATFIGIAPAAFIVASIGAGLRDVLASGARPDLSILLSAPILAPLLGLAILALAPVVWKKWRAAHG